MKKIGLLALLIVILANTAFAKVDKWQTFKEAGFEIEFPYRPKHTTQAVNSEVGVLNIGIFMYEAIPQEKDENLVYTIMTTVYPDSLINTMKPEMLATFFRSAIDGGTKAMNGKVLSEKTIDFNGIPGRYVRVSFGDGAYIMNMKAFLVKNKLYMVQVASEISNEENSSATRFLNSFKLLD